MARIHRQTILLAVCVTLISLVGAEAVRRTTLDDHIKGLTQGTWRIPRSEDDHDHGSEDDHDDGSEDDHDHGSEDDHDHDGDSNCPTEEELEEEFTVLAAELGVVGENGTTCAREGERRKRGGEEGGSGSLVICSSCDTVYDLCRDLIIHLGLTSECCLANGTECEEDSQSSTQRTSDGKAYGYGFLMVLLVSVGSLSGVIIVPLVKKDSRFGRFYKYIYALMISLGASALFCDAILHLLPHALGLHSHEETDAHDHGDDDHEIPDYIWKSCALIGGLYGFFLLEVLLHTWNDSHGHHHHHGDILDNPETAEDHKLSHPVHLEATIPHNQCREAHKEATFIHPSDDGGSVKRASSDCVLLPPESINRKENLKHKSIVKRVTKYVLKIKPLAWLIILGDSVHNFADGLALGASIAQSIALGLSTMIAIVFHEIPHEMSDYAILLSTGMEWYTALLFNFLSSLTAVVGFFVGVAIGTASEVANEWILAVTAGIFLYIALVDLLPDLIHSKEKGRTRWWLFIMANIGFYISFAVLLVIAIYEEDLNTLVDE